MREQNGRILGWACGWGFVLVSALGASAGEPDRKELIELGRRLFFEPAVHRSGRIACADCHDPEHGFSDPRAVSVEHDGPMRRHSQPLTDLANGTGMHWDGEFDTVRELIDARLAPGRVSSFSAQRNRERHFERARREGRRPDRREFEESLEELPAPIEKGSVGSKRREVDPFMPIAERLHFSGRYKEAFEAVFGKEEPKVELILDALEAYVLSLRTDENAVDRFLRGDATALDDSQKRGHELFTGKANCVKCHSMNLEDGRAATTDRSYRSTGIAYPALIVPKKGPHDGDGGRGEMTHVRADLGRFKVPSLRDVARRAPYMHDGSLRTLESVVEYYARGGRGPNLDPAIEPLELSDTEKADLVAFLKALTGDRRAGIGPATRTQQTRLTIVDVEGRPMRDLAVRVRPAGDRLEGGRRPEPMDLLTDKRGRIEFLFPRWTHVVVEANGLEVGGGYPIPDSVRAFELRAVTKGKMYLEIVQAPSVPKLIHVTDEKGQSLGELRRIRKLGGQRALYEVVDFPRERLGQHVLAKLSNDGRREGRIEFDLSLGEIQSIFLPSPNSDPNGGDGYGG